MVTPTGGIGFPSRISFRRALGFAAPPANGREVFSSF
jgi:hypothetical protein